jgi:hypothetical protein
MTAFFDVRPSDPSLGMIDAAVDGDRLLILFAGRNVSEVVVTNHSGILLRQTLLSSHRAIRIAPMSNGRTALLCRRGSRGRSLVELDSDLQPTRDLPVLTSTTHMFAQGSMVVGAGPAIVWAAELEGSAQYTTGSWTMAPGPAALAQAGTGQVIVLNLITGECLRVTANGQTAAHRLLEGPELKERKNSLVGTEGLFAPVIAADATKFYCMLGRYKPREGAAILQYDIDGNYIGKYTLQIPLFPAFVIPETPGKLIANPTGMLLISRMLTAGNDLFLVDFVHARVARMWIPPR